MFKIAVLASTNGTVLQAIINEIQAGKMPNIELLRVVSDVEDCGALRKARQHGFEAVFIDPKGKDRQAVDKELAMAVGEVDLVCLAGFMRILSRHFIHKYRRRIINVHPSLLPMYGGKGWYGNKVHEAVLANGDKESGMTVHYVDEGVDSGIPILQERIPVEDGDTVEILKDKVQMLEKVFYPEAIRIIEFEKTNNPFL